MTNALAYTDTINKLPRRTAQLPARRPGITTTGFSTGKKARAPSTSNSFILSSLWCKSDSQLSKYSIVCDREISWRRRQQLTALSISTALVTTLLPVVKEQPLQPAVKFAVSFRKPRLLSSFAPLRNKS